MDQFEAKKQPFDTVRPPNEHILHFIQSIEAFGAESCAAVYSTNTEVVAVYGQGKRVVDRVRNVSMDNGFRMLGTVALDAKVFEGTPEEIEQRVIKAVDDAVHSSHQWQPLRLVNAQTPLWET